MSFVHLLVSVSTLGILYFFALDNSCYYHMYVGSVNFDFITRAIIILSELIVQHAIISPATAFAYSIPLTSFISSFSACFHINVVVVELFCTFLLLYFMFLHFKLIL